MAQQTAVEWLKSQMENMVDGYFGSPWVEMFEQAKEMEQQQIEKAVIYGLDEDGHTGDWKISVGRKYYNDQYVDK
jgi:hypothetical protein